MENKLKQTISSALIEAMDKEDLHTRQAAQLLNLNPCYVSMARNEKSWDAMGKAPWIRLEEWYNSREALKNFVIPEGEPVWVPAGKPVSPPLRSIGKVIEVKKEASVDGTTSKSIKLDFKAIDPMRLKEKKIKTKKEIFTDPRLSDLICQLEEKQSKIMNYEKELLQIELLNAKISDLEMKLSKAATLEVTTPEVQVLNQKIALDIEINLILNGHRVQL